MADKVYKPARNGYFRDPFNNHRMQIGKPTHNSVLSWFKKDPADFVEKLKQFGYDDSEMKKIITTLKKSQEARDEMKRSATPSKRALKSQSLVQKKNSFESEMF